MLISTLIDNIERFLNRVLAQDAMAMVALQELANRTIAAHFTGPEVTVYFHCHESGIALSTTPDRKADVIIRARPTTYIGLLINRDDNAVFPRDMEINGDVGLAQRFQSIMKNLEIDWEEYLSHWLGDTMAHKLGNLFRDFSRYSRETATTVGLDVSEYLRFEKEIVADQDQIAEFISAVDELRNDAERLRQRITRLAASQPEES